LFENVAQEVEVEEEEAPALHSRRPVVGERLRSRLW
jgi:hypothetical protein